MNVTKTDIAKIWIFLSSLMLFFGVGNYLASVILTGDLGVDQSSLRRWSVVWIMLAVGGAVLFGFGIVQLRRARRMMKRLVYLAEPNDESHNKWFVIAHNLDDAGDVEAVAGPFGTEAEAQVEVQRLEHHG